MGFKTLQKNPLLLNCISWVKFHLNIKIKKNLENKKIIYSYSLLLFNDNLNKEIICDNWNFDNIRYQHGFIKI